MFTILLTACGEGETNTAKEGEIRGTSYTDAGEVSDSKWTQFDDLNKELKWGLTPNEAEGVMEQTGFSRIYAYSDQDDVYYGNYLLSHDTDDNLYLHYEGTVRGVPVAISLHFTGKVYLQEVQYIFSDEVINWQSDDERGTFIKEVFNHFGECSNLESCTWDSDEEQIYFSDSTDSFSISGLGNLPDKKEIEKNKEKFEKQTGKSVEKNDAEFLEHVDMYVENGIEQIKQQNHMTDSSASYTPGDYPTAIVTEINVLPDEFPELMKVNQEYGYSRVEFFRFDSTSGKWIIFYEIQPIENYNNTEPLMFLGVAKLSEDGLDYPIVGKWSGSGGFFSFQIFGPRNESFGIALDKIDEAYPAGHLEINNNNKKVHILSEGQVVETITENELEFKNVGMLY